MLHDWHKTLMRRFDHLHGVPLDSPVHSHDRNCDDATLNTLAPELSRVFQERRISGCGQLEPISVDRNQRLRPRNPQRVKKDAIIRESPTLSIRFGCGGTIQKESLLNAA
jgi:hypothetical protein